MAIDGVSGVGAAISVLNFALFIALAVNGPYVAKSMLFCLKSG